MLCKLEKNTIICSILAEHNNAFHGTNRTIVTERKAKDWAY